MDGNYSCSLCPQVAVQCCLCSTSRTYLCQTCVLPHTSSKIVYHPLVPVSTPAYVTKDNLAEYDRRMTALGKVRGQLEAVSAQLTAERSGLDQAFNDIYNQQTQRLYQVCSDIYADINAYYVRIQVDIEAFKQEINKTEQSQNVTDVARKYVEVGLHLVQPIAFLDIRGEMSRRIQVTATGDNLGVQDCLMTAFRQWKTAPCSCSDCCEIKAALLGTYQYWSCQMCGLYQNWATNCYQCRASNPAKMRSFSPSIGANIHWQCQNCKNLQSNIQKSCAQCGCARPPFVGVPAPTGLQREALLPNWICTNCNYTNCRLNVCEKCHIGKKTPAVALISQPQRRTTWICMKCGHANSSADQNCQKCVRIPGNGLQPSQTFRRANLPSSSRPATHSLNLPPASVEQTRYRKCRYCRDAFQTTQQCLICGFSDDGSQWKCFGCANSNLATDHICGKCSAPKNLGLYLVSRGEMGLTEWNCKCGAKTQIYIPKCSRCGKESEKVQKALEYAGNSIGWGELFGKMFGLG